MTTIHWNNIIGMHAFIPFTKGQPAIHGIDLLGRKIRMKNGKAFALYLHEVEDAIEKTKDNPLLEPYGRQLAELLERLKEVTIHLMGVEKEKGPEHFLADATLYLELFGIIAIGWQWLLQATVIEKALEGKCSKTDNYFYQGKLFAFRYFFGYELLKAEGLIKRLMHGDGVTVDMEVAFFIGLNAQERSKCFTSTSDACWG